MTNDNLEIVRLMREGATDAGLARLFGVPRRTVGSIRRRAGIAPKPRGTGTRYMAEETWRSLYDQGFNDYQIARATGFARQSIARRRKIAGLPVQPDAAGSGTGSATKRWHRDAIALHDQGFSDVAIADRFGYGSDAVRGLRRRLGLKSNRPKRAKPRKLPPVIDQGWRDPLIAAARRAVGSALASDVADDAVSNLVLAVLEGRLSADAISAHARRYAGRAIGEYASGFGPLSLDQIRGDGFTLATIIPDRAASAWLEEMGATYHG